MRDENKIPDIFSWKIITVISLIIILILFLLELEYDILPLIKIRADGSLDSIVIATIVICFTWLFLHIGGKAFERFGTTLTGSQAQARSIWRMVGYIIWIIVLMILIFSMTGEVSSLMIYAGLIGAALTFVLQKPLLNILAWALISFRGIYRIGDRIAINNVKGYVMDIKIMYTELREFGEWMKGDTFTGRIVAVPNSMVFDYPVYNYTRDFPFVWDEVTAMVTYESDIDIAKKYIFDSAREVVGELMKTNYDLYRRRMELKDLEQLLLKEPALRMEMADSGVNIYVLYYCPAEMRRLIRSEITEKIWRKFMEDPRVDIAYPHMHILGKLG